MVRTEKSLRDREGDPRGVAKSNRRWRSRGCCEEVTRGRRMAFRCVFVRSVVSYVISLCLFSTQPYDKRAACMFVSSADSLFFPRLKPDSARFSSSLNVHPLDPFHLHFLPHTHPLHSSRLPLYQYFEPIGLPCICLFSRTRPALPTASTAPDAPLPRLPLSLACLPSPVSPFLDSLVPSSPYTSPSSSSLTCVPPVHSGRHAARPSGASPRCPLRDPPNGFLASFPRRASVLR